MGRKNYLPELIWSLNKSETRYFRLVSSIQSGDKNYLKLFDEILKHNAGTYSEKKIKDKFENEKFINQLTFTKNYLYSAIIKSLVLYAGEETVDIQVNSMINKARVLFNKALYAQFFHLLKKAKETCLKHERFSSFLQLLEMEKIVIIKKISPEAGSSIDEAKLYEEEISILNKLRNLAEYQNLVSRLTGLFRMKGRAREDSVSKLISAMKESHVMMSPDRADSVIALERYYFVLQLTADLLGDFRTMHSYAVKRYELIIENPFPFRDQMFNYRQDILLYMILLGSRLSSEHEPGISPPEKQRKFLDMLKEHTGHTDIEKINLFLIESTIKLNNISGFPDYKTALSVIESIVNGLNRFRGKLDLNYEILIYNSIVKICVYFGDYSSANTYLNILLNLPQLSIRKDIELYARIQNLIVHFELGNFELLEYLIRSTYRFLINMNNVYGFERAVINFLRKLTSVNTDKQLLENLELLKIEIEELKKDPFEKNAMLYFDFPLWVDKKIQALRMK